MIQNSEQLIPFLITKVHFVPYCYKNMFHRYQKEHIFRNNSFQITPKGLNCSSRDSELGTIVSHVIERNIFLGTILGFHPRDETAMLVYKTIENGPTSFA